MELLLHSPAAARALPGLEGGKDRPSQGTCQSDSSHIGLALKCQALASSNTSKRNNGGGSCHPERPQRSCTRMCAGAGAESRTLSPCPIPGGCPMAPAPHPPLSPARGAGAGGCTSEPPEPPQASSGAAGLSWISCCTFLEGSWGGGL